MLTGPPGLSLRSVREILTPRTRRTTIAAHETVGNALVETVARPPLVVAEMMPGLIASSQQTLYPVYSTSLDDLGGVLHGKNFTRARTIGSGQPLSGLLPRGA